MSLQTRYRPWPDQAGPSDHDAPVQIRWIAVLFRRNAPNAGSIVMRSGSGYVIGGAPGLKSRGGFETTDGGLLRAGGAVGACARPCSTREDNAAAPVAAPIWQSTSRREYRISNLHTTTRFRWHRVAGEF